MRFLTERILFQFPMKQYDIDEHLQRDLEFNSKFKISMFT